VLLPPPFPAAGWFSRVQVFRSPGRPSLVREARTAALVWRFDPALASGVPVQCDVDLPIEFDLE
jgi:outer membrane biosynthesis protein TonB